MMTMPTTRIIAFFGYKGCGKSEAAKQLIEAHGFTRHSFATPLKRMLQTLGLSEADLWGAHKETPSALLGGKTPRWAMQSLGSEWGRTCIDANIWVRAWQQSLPSGAVVVDDMRFPNEAVAVKLVGGHIVKIERPGLQVDTSHESEKYVEGPEALPGDEIIINDGTLESFQTRIILLNGRLNMKTGRTPTQ
jgi:hypothetical protein